MCPLIIIDKHEIVFVVFESPVSGYWSCPYVERIDNFTDRPVFRIFLRLPLAPQTLLAWKKILIGLFKETWLLLTAGVVGDEIQLRVGEVVELEEPSWIFVIFTLIHFIKMNDLNAARLQ